MRTRRRGFVLVATLWLLVALAAVGLDAALRSRTRRLAAANQVDETRATAAAMAGVEYARSRLTAAMLDRADELRSDALRSARTASQQRSAANRSVRSLFNRSDPLEDPWRDPEQLVATEMAFGDARYTLRLRDTGAALNLNEAPEDVLRNFFAQGLRVDYAQADKLAQAILDWRDEDDIPRINGGEREQYVEENLPVLPANRDFAELDELRHVMGMTPELYALAAPYLRLVGSDDININAAPEPVLMALPDIRPGEVQQLLRLRESGYAPRNATQLRDLIPSLGSGTGTASRRRFNSMITFATNEVEITSEGRIDGSPMRVTARVIVQRSNTGAVVVWRRVD